MPASYAQVRPVVMVNLSTQRAFGCFYFLEFAATEGFNLMASSAENFQILVTLMPLRSVMQVVNMKVLTINYLRKPTGHFAPIA